MYFADWRAPPATFVARKQRTAKKRESGGYDQLMASYPSANSQDSVFQTLNPCMSVYTCIFLEASGNCYISKILSYLFLSCLDPWYNSSLWKRSLGRGTHRHDRYLNDETQRERENQGPRWLRRYVSPVSPSPGLVKLLALSNQQACGKYALAGLSYRTYFVMCGFYYLYSITTSIALSTRTNALSVCGIWKPP